MPPRKLNTTKTTKRKSRAAVVMDSILSRRDNPNVSPHVSQRAGSVGGWLDLFLYVLQADWM
jgi:hypothetical protein